MVHTVLGNVPMATLLHMQPIAKLSQDLNKGAEERQRKRVGRLQTRYLLPRQEISPFQVYAFPHPSVKAPRSLWMLRNLYRPLHSELAATWL